MPPTHPACRPRRSAFTLIELLTVIAIIAVLASLMMPAIKTVRSKARDVSCGTNMRQALVAIFAYNANWPAGLSNCRPGCQWEGQTMTGAGDQCR